MKLLVIAEKPSVARDIATALGGFARQGSGNDQWLERSDMLVSSAIGHLVELACPKQDDPGYDLDRLPAAPAQFGLAPIERTKSQLALLKKLMQRPDIDGVINACDAGREGELIFRYIYLYCGCRKPMQRMWLQSMTAQAIKDAAAKLRPGASYDALFAAAQSRSEADWLVGINATRAVSILYGRLAGKLAKFTVGRVQTPTMYLIVEREERIRNFVPKKYFEVHATFAARAGEYSAKWVNTRFVADPKNPDARPDRLFDKSAAEAILRQCQHQMPSSVQDTATEQMMTAPRLFDLTTLQREANKRFGFSAKHTLELAQVLYEKHKVLTYPRTDSTALPEDYPETARLTLQKLGQGGLTVSPFAAKAAGLVKPDKRIFNNAKISDHFAIIPTGQIASLAGDEAKIFDLVARRFVAAFFPVAKYLATERITIVAHESFRSSGRVLVEEGWLAVYGREADDQDEPGLCAVAPGEIPRNAGMEVVSAQTKPPVRFTEATLLAAMESAGAQIEDEDLREAMKERGLGTPATRAAIVEKLLDVEYIARQKKMLVPTEKAEQLVQFLRGNGLMALASAETTGSWEQRLRQMEQGKFARREFMANIHAMARDLVERVRAKAPAAPARSQAPQQALSCRCPKCGGTLASNGNMVQCQAGDFKLWLTIAERSLSEPEVVSLVGKRQLAEVTGFKSKAGKAFSAGLRLADDLSGKVEFVFAGRQ